MATDPVCGMYVEERGAELTLVRDNRTYYFCATSCRAEFEAPERRARALRRQLLVAWPLAVAVAALTYVAPFPPWTVVALLAAAVVQGYPGFAFYRGTVDAVRGRIWNMDVLIAVGTTTAFAYSAAVVLLPGRLPPGTYFDASALIVTLILTGNYLEQRTRHRARGALRALADELPRTVVVRGEGGDRELRLDQLRPGDRLVVRPGARVPADGVIVDGRSELEEGVLTGEPLPVPRGPGDRVLAGSVNGPGVLLVATEKVGGDSFLGRIGELVAEAETGRVPLQRLADRIAAVFVPAVLAVAVVSALAWFFIGGAPAPVALLIFVAVAITACPCAFGLATPAAIVVGAGRAAEEGVVYRTPEAMARASRIDTVLTDKTGTLTAGRPRLTAVVPTDGRPPEELLALAAALESGSEHPIARAVRAAAEGRGVRSAPADDVVAVPGSGVRGRVEGRPAEVRRSDPPPGDAGSAGAAAGWSEVRRDDRTIGWLAFEDPALPGVRASVEALRREGIEVVMATGDSEASARSVADSTGIGIVHARLDPAGKLAVLRALRGAGRTVAFVGDGINDAPALAASDLGIAVGSGTDVAREAGDVLLLRPGFEGVGVALRVARRTVRRVRSNLLWALAYNAVLLPIAAGALVPVWGFGVYDVLPIAGALAMAFSSTTVVLGSLLLRRGSVRAVPRPGPPSRSAIPG